MTPSVRNLTKKMDQLKVSAKVATNLAASERMIADQQHTVARELEILADGLDKQVIAIKAEIVGVIALDSEASPSKLTA